MTPAKTVSLSTKKSTTTPALAGVFCLSIRALITRTSRCHSRMLAAEISGAGEQHGAAAPACADKHSKRRYHAYNQRLVQSAPEHCVKIFIGEIDDGVSFLGHDLGSGVPFPVLVLVLVSHTGILLGRHRHLDHVEQSRNAPEDDAGDLNPFLVQCVAQPPAASPADERRPPAARRRPASAFRLRPDRRCRRKFRRAVWRRFEAVEGHSFVVIHDERPSGRNRRALIYLAFGGGEFPGFHAVLALDRHSVGRD